MTRPLAPHIPWRHAPFRALSLATLALRALALGAAAQGTAPGPAPGPAPGLAPGLATGLATSPTPAVRAEPFPYDKTQTLRRENASYFVDGRQVIPKNVKIVSLRQMTLVGTGDKPTLVVEGVLDLRAVTGGWARLENLSIELAPGAKELMLMDVDLGPGAKVVPSELGPCDAKVTLMNSKISSGGAFEVSMDAGDVTVMGSLAEGPIRVHGARRSEAKGSNVKVVLVMNTGPLNGLRGGLSVQGAKELTVRLNDLAGKRILLENNDKLAFDANNVRCETLEFRDDEAGRLPKAKIEANDFRCKTMIFQAPGKKAGQVERLALSGNWFGGATDDETIRAAMIQDSGSLPESCILVRIKDVSSVALGLGGRLE